MPYLSLNRSVAPSYDQDFGHDDRENKDRDRYRNSTIQNYENNFQLHV